MSLRIRFRFDGCCTRHPRYDPKRDGRHRMGNVKDVNSLYVIHLYTKIAKRRTEDAYFIVVRASTGREEQQSTDVQPSSETGAQS